MVKSLEEICVLNFSFRIALNLQDEVLCDGPAVLHPAGSHGCRVAAGAGGQAGASFGERGAVLPDAPQPPCPLSHLPGTRILCYLCPYLYGFNSCNTLHALSLASDKPYETQDRIWFADVKAPRCVQGQVIDCRPQKAKWPATIDATTRVFVHDVSSR